MKSNLAKLYQSIILKNSVLQIIDIFSSFPPADKNLVFEMICVGASYPKTEDLNWGEHHALDDRLRFYFYLAVRKAISMKLERLSQDQKNQVYGNVYRLAGSPATDDGQWGEHHALDNLPRLNDAIDSLKLYS
jgi:hypothetical protein